MVQQDRAGATGELEWAQFQHLINSGSNWDNNEQPESTPKLEGSLEVGVKVGFLDVI